MQSRRLLLSDSDRTRLRSTYPNVFRPSLATRMSFGLVAAGEPLPAFSAAFILFHMPLAIPALRASSSPKT